MCVEKVALRAPEPEDLELLYEWENRKSLWQVSNTIAPFSKYVLRQYLETAHQDIFQTRQLRLMIELLAPGKPKTIGAVDLFDFEPVHERAGVGILIGDRAEKGKGYAKVALGHLIEYVFKTLHLKQLYCNISESNTVSQNLFTQAGFTEIGKKRFWNKTETGFEDEIMYQLINSKQLF